MFAATGVNYMNPREQVPSGGVIFLSHVDRCGGSCAKFTKGTDPNVKLVR